MRLIDADFARDKVNLLGGGAPWSTESVLAMLEACPTIAPPPNDPLTLEEMREMGGEPYWHVGLQDDSPPPHWSILDPFFAKHIEDYGCGVRWLAYRRKPEEGTQ